MKQLLLLAAFFAFTTSMAAQDYRLSGGLLGAVNYDKFRIDGLNPDNVEYEYKAGWSLGAWLNLPLGSAFSVEPQVMYSFYDFQSLTGSDLLTSGGLNLFSVPVLLKIHPHRYWAITVGPQIDFLGSFNNTSVDFDEDDFESTNFSLSLGLELLPHEVVTIFGRYVHGFTDLNASEPSGDTEYYTSNWQAGVKVALFGLTPPDKDGDGVLDDVDSCPDVFGLASLAGCPDRDGDGITDAGDQCPDVAGISKYFGCPIPDSDKDGVNDELDNCPMVVGTAKYNGCPPPDTDGDSINDELDKCPTQAGIAKYDGCPIPDTDGDGINDENDQCPTVAGLAAHNGCPNPDRDSDGVANASDLCPDIPGPASNEGCPVVESPKFNARMINFRTGSAELTAQSKLDLREGAALMNSAAFNGLVFHIHGHTDNVGSDESNHTLSHKRAESVRAELIKNGVPAERMTSEGFGETKPIADNSTADGRALNRRVEILARHSQPVNVPQN